MAEGEQSLVIRTTNAHATPKYNFWMLESFVGKTLEQAWIGAINDVRQRGVGAGYEIVQGLEVIITPTSTQIGMSVLVHVWFRTRVYVALHGFLELHVALNFHSGCSPLIIPLSTPPSQCRSFIDSSGIELRDLHRVLELKLEEQPLLPNTEYEFVVHVVNPSFVLAKVDSWGMRLRNPIREVIQANMQVPGYQLTDWGLSFASLVPSSTLPLAMIEIRMILDFTKTLNLKNIQDIRILAPKVWEIICMRFRDITGGEVKAAQLPYSMERGHHRCPTKYALILYMNQVFEIKASRYTLLLGLYNPARAVTKDLWSVSLLSPAENLGWSPYDNENKSSDDETTIAGFSADGLRHGQQVLAESFILGFGIQGQYGGTTPPPEPLQGEIMFDTNLGMHRWTLPGSTICLCLVAVFGWF